LKKRSSLLQRRRCDVGDVCYIRSSAKKLIENVHSTLKYSRMYVQFVDIIILNLTILHMYIHIYCATN
jgi:hypothetical protein